MSTAMPPRQPPEATPSLVRLVLRDYRVLDARLHLNSSQTLAKSLGRDRGFLNLTDAQWLDTGEQSPHLVLRADRILWVAAYGETTLIGPHPTGTELRPAEIGLTDGLTIRAQLILLANQRLTDYLHSSGAFIPLREARLTATGRWLGDVLLNVDEVLTVREAASVRDTPPASGSRGSAATAAVVPAAPPTSPSAETPPRSSPPSEAASHRPDDLAAVREWYHASLMARVEALEAARAELKRNTPVGLEWIRGIAYSLRRSATLQGLPEVTAAALALERSMGTQALDALDRMLLVLRGVLARSRSERPVVLIVENDSEAVRALESRLAAPSRDLVVARTGAEAERLITEHTVSLVLLDRTLPDRDGLELLPRLRTLHTTEAVPTFVLSAQADGADWAECFALGADACFDKPIDIELVAAAVESELRRGLSRAPASRRDPVTGLPDRTAFQEAFDQAAALARRAREPLCMALLDLHDGSGAAGEAVEAERVRYAAEVVSRGLRPSDLVARLDDGMFAILFPNTHRRGARVALEKMLEALRLASASDGDLTFSAGVGEFVGGERFEEAFERVGALRFQAREAGPGRIASADDELASLPANRILLVESDDILASVIRYRLEREGFEVVHCADGRAALATLKAQRFSLVVTDLKLPKLGGLELLERLRRVSSYGDVPVVMLTAAANEQDMARGFRLGADDYIVKPVSMTELLARVRRLTAKFAS